MTGNYVTKKQALELLSSMGIDWNNRQIDLTAEPDVNGQRQWPWFLDDKGILRIDAGFIRAHFQEMQARALQEWKKNGYKL